MPMKMVASGRWQVACEAAQVDLPPANLTFIYAMGNFLGLARDHQELKRRATKRRRVNPAFGRVTTAKAPFTGRCF